MTDIAVELLATQYDGDNMPRMESEKWLPVGLARRGAEEILKLRQALLPFATCLTNEQWDLLLHVPDDTIWKGNITFGDLRRAKDAMK